MDSPTTRETNSSKSTWPSQLVSKSFMILSTAAGSFWDWVWGREQDGQKSKVTVKAQVRTVWARSCLSPSHPEEVGELVLHQLSQLASAERAIPALPGGITVEDGDERLHGGLQFWRHGCCCVVELHGDKHQMQTKVLDAPTNGRTGTTYQESVPSWWPYLGTVGMLGPELIILA